MRDVMLSSAVMHVPTPERKAWLAQVLAEFPDAIVVTDSDRCGVWPTAKAAWMVTLLDAHATHCLVLQDDMVPFDGTRDRLLAAIAEYPSMPVSGFQSPDTVIPCEHDRYHVARQSVLTGAVWGGTCVLPRAIALRVAQDGDRHLGLDDDRIAACVREMGGEFLHVYPPMFDHVGWNASLHDGAPCEWKRGQGARLHVRS